MIVWFDSSCIHKIQTAQSALDKIAALQEMIDILDAAMLLRPEQVNQKGYLYEDGMTKTSMQFQDSKAMTDYIKGLEARQQRLLQSPGLNSRVNRMVDGKNFTGRIY